MKTLELQQGTPEWAAHRAHSHNASDAPAMMGASPYKTRDELIAQYATGIEPEVDAVTQVRFNEGHRVEALGRAMAEAQIGEDLYPVVGESDDGYLSASFDGLTLDNETTFECKLWNESKAADVRTGRIPGADRWQLVQQAVVSGCKRLLYMVTDGTPEKCEAVWAQGNDLRAHEAELRAGWAQFDEDVAAYQTRTAAPQVQAAPVAQFGALSLRVEGRVLASNLDAFKANAEAFVAKLPKPDALVTDQDFADADAAAKACAEAESRVKAAKEAAQAQMTDIDAAFRLADEVAQTIRAARLALEKAVKSEKENRRAAIVRAGVDAVRAHYAASNKSLGDYAVAVPQTLVGDLGASIKGLKTLASIENAVNTAVAAAKIACSTQADAIRGSAHVMSEFVSSHPSLFPDRVALVHSKSAEDLRNLCAQRVAEAKAQEAARLEAERARIRTEEAAKAERAEKLRLQAIAEAERQRVAEGERLQREADARNVTGVRLPTPAEPGATPSRLVSLGEIKEMIAPLSISAAGLAEIGITPAKKKGVSTLYRATDMLAMQSAMIEVIRNARVKEAA